MWFFKLPILLQILLIILLHYVALVSYFHLKWKTGSKKFHIASYLQYFDFVTLFQSYFRVFEKIGFEAMPIHEKNTLPDLSEYKNLPPKLKNKCNSPGLKELYEILFSETLNFDNLENLDFQKEVGQALILCAFYSYLAKKKYKEAVFLMEKVLIMDLPDFPRHTVYCLNAAARAIATDNTNVFADPTLLGSLKLQPTLSFPEKLIYVHGLYYRHAAASNFNFWPLRLLTTLSSLSKHQRSPASHYYIAVFYGLNNKKNKMHDSLIRTLYYGQESSFYPRLIRNNFNIRSKFKDVYQKAEELISFT